MRFTHVLSVLILTIGAATATLAQDKPNIVVIMTDNQGYGDLGSYGGVRADTPRIDQLASEGVQFLDFQVEPGCTPTRAAFQTGRMPVRSGNDGYVEPGQPGGLHPKKVTIAELLKSIGYSTAMYGKWHLGENSERQPQMQGFDEWYGITNTTVPVDPSFPGAGFLSLVQQKILYAKGGQEAKQVGENHLEARSLMDREIDADGNTQERVFDVALSDDRSAGILNKKIPAVGGTVDIADASYTNTIGEAVLATVWIDPEFKANQRAFYYARVIEIPTPRWTAYDRKAYGLTAPEGTPLTVQDRAYTTPTWYTP